MVDLVANPGRNDAYELSLQMGYALGKSPQNAMMAMSLVQLDFVHGVGHVEHLKPTSSQPVLENASN